MDILKLLPILSDTEDILWKYYDNETFQKFSQHVEYKPINTNQLIETNNSLKCIVKIDKNQQPEMNLSTLVTTENVKKQRKCKIKPLDLILELSSNIEINMIYIKTKLIDFISSKTFQKFFGVKKTSEVMSSLTSDKWNKSLVLFISFIFDVSFIYLNKVVSYDIDKKYDKCIKI